MAGRLDQGTEAADWKLLTDDGMRSLLSFRLNGVGRTYLCVKESE